MQGFVNVQKKVVMRRKHISNLDQNLSNQKPQSKQKSVEPSRNKEMFTP